MEQVPGTGEVKNKCHEIKKVSFVRGKLLLSVDGVKYSFPLSDVSKRLGGASRAEREKYEISPSGYGIHWPLIDEDLSIDGLIRTERKQTRAEESISA